MVDLKGITGVASLLLGAGAVATVAVTASADVDSLDRADLWADTAEDINETPGLEDFEETRRVWSVNIGLIAGGSPDYEGSNDYEFGFGPNFDITWRDTIFYKGKSLGAYLIREKGLRAGSILSWTSGRDEDDNDKLDGLGDVDSTVEAGGFISYRNKPLRFRLEARQDINSGHEGALVEMSAGSTLPLQKPLVFVALGTTWASDDYMESFFGVSSKQSGRSGLRTHNADAGIKDINLSLTAGHRFKKHWRIGGRVEYKRLIGDAADSPIVDDKNQFMAGISLSYRTGSRVQPE